MAATSSRLAKGKRIFSRPIIGLIRLYQVLLSPFFGSNCRFMPSCSQYAVEAIEAHGVLRGMFLAIKRIGRCHPWGGSGYDPVPDNKE